jgi:hypothetical protein
MNIVYIIVAVLLLLAIKGKYSLENIITELEQLPGGTSVNNIEIPTSCALVNFCGILNDISMLELTAPEIDNRTNANKTNSTIDYKPPRGETNYDLIDSGLLLAPIVEYQRIPDSAQVLQSYQEPRIKQRDPPLIIPVSMIMYALQDPDNNTYTGGLYYPIPGDRYTWNDYCTNGNPFGLHLKNQGYYEPISCANDMIPKNMTKSCK